MNLFKYLTADFYDKSVSLQKDYSLWTDAELQANDKVSQVARGFLKYLMVPKVLFLYALVLLRIRKAPVDLDTRLKERLLEAAAKKTPTPNPQAEAAVATPAPAVTADIPKDIVSA